MEESKNSDHIKTIKVEVKEDDITKNAIRVSELEKSQDPDNYIFNPESGKYVKINSTKGRKLAYGDNPPSRTKISKTTATPKFKINKVSRQFHQSSLSEAIKDKPTTSSFKINLVGRSNRKLRKVLDETMAEPEQSTEKKELIDLGQQISEEILKQPKSLQREPLHHDGRTTRNLKPEVKQKEDIVEPKVETVPTRPKRVIHYGGSRKVQIQDNKKSSKKSIMYVYTDGAVSNNHDSTKSVGGIGVYFGPKDNRNISERFREGRVTNQRAELYAIIRTFETIIDDRLHCRPEIKIIIYTDSMYALNIITKKWKAKDNLDLVGYAWKLLKQIPNVELKHIRAHTRKNDVHSQGNAMADELARKGRG